MYFDHGNCCTVINYGFEKTFVVMLWIHLTLASFWLSFPQQFSLKQAQASS
uniref:Uncharacterized protein n=1 Tax=Anguilla anguilla TaxID=7936 RepID=A0A0E9WEV6_ANGAN